MFVGVSLTKNHQFRSILMIHQSTSCCEHILYPSKGIRPELVMDPLVYSVKGSSKYYYTFLPMVAT